MVIHNRIKELRAKHGLTQEALAELTGVSRQTIIALEQDKYLPSLALAFSLGAALQATVEEIFIQGQ
jgi:putative transcriptional regulator